MNDRESATLESTGAMDPAEDGGHVFCHHLRTKKMFARWDVLASQEQILATRTHQNFWCQHTMTSTGPDDCFVEHTRCNPGRACYEPMRAE